MGWSRLNKRTREEPRVALWLWQEGKEETLRKVPEEGIKGARCWSSHAEVELLVGFQMEMPIRQLRRCPCAWCQGCDKVTVRGIQETQDHKP